MSESAIGDLQYVDVEYLETVDSTFSSNLEQLKEIYLTDLVDPKDLEKIRLVDPGKILKIFEQKQ